MRSTVITISRQFGSGGRLIGAELSKRLGIPCYEKTLFEEAARHSGIHPLSFEQAEGSNDRIYANAFSCRYTPMDMSLDDRMYIAQRETIQKLAQRGPCIIVGRGANRILEGYGDLLNLFIYAERAIRRRRAVDLYGIPEERAEKLLDSIDKKRAAYLKFYTGQVFGKAENYHLCIDSGKLGIEHTVQLIEGVCQTMKGSLSGQMGEGN